MRKKIFERQITMEVYEEENGRVSVEGSLLDTMPLDAGYFKVGRRPADQRPPGVLHGLDARWEVDLQTREVVKSEGTFSNPAFAGCPAFLTRLKDLEGQRMGPGFTDVLLEKTGGHLGCEHMSSLLVSMLRIPYGAYYLSPPDQREDQPDGGHRRQLAPRLRCHMFRPGGPVEQAEAKGINVFTEDW